MLNIILQSHPAPDCISYPLRNLTQRSLQLNSRRRLNVWVPFGNFPYRSYSVRVCQSVQHCHGDCKYHYSNVSLHGKVQLCHVFSRVPGLEKFHCVLQVPVSISTHPQYISTHGSFDFVLTFKDLRILIAHNTTNYRTWL